MLRSISDTMTTLLFIILCGAAQVGADTMSAVFEVSTLVVDNEVELFVTLNKDSGFPNTDPGNKVTLEYIETNNNGQKTTVVVDFVTGVASHKFATAKAGTVVCVGTIHTFSSSGNQPTPTASTSVLFLADASVKLVATPSTVNTAVPETPSIQIALFDQHDNPTTDEVTISATLTGISVPTDSQMLITTQGTYQFPEMTLVQTVTVTFGFVGKPNLPEEDVTIEFTAGTPTAYGLAVVESSDQTVDNLYTIELKLIDAYSNIVPDAVFATVTVTDQGGVESQDVTVSLVTGTGSTDFTLTLPAVHTAVVSSTGVTAAACPSGCNPDSSSFTVLSGQAVEYVIVDPTDGDPNDPNADGSTDTSLVVTIQAHDQYANVAKTQSSSVTLMLSSNTASFVNGGGGVANIVTGQATITIADTVAELVSLSLVDTAQTGLDVTSTQVVRFYWGAPVQFYINIPGTATIRSQLSIAIEVRDVNNNVVEIEERDVSLTVSGDATPASQVVNIVKGRATVKILNKIQETVTLALVDSAATNLVVDSTRVITFVPMDPPPYIELQLDLSSIVAGFPVKATAIVRNGANSGVIEPDMLETATLVAIEERTGVPQSFTIDMSDTTSRGIGIGTFTTSRSGKVTLQVISDPQFGVTDSDIFEVQFVPDDPAIFLIEVDATTVLVDEEILISVTSTDQHGNPTDAGSLEVDVVLTGTETGSALALPLQNPTRLQFGDGQPAQVALSSTQTEHVNIHLETPFPSTVVVTDSNVVEFTFGPLHRVFFESTPDGTVDQTHLFTLTAGDSFYNKVDNGNLNVNVAIDDGTSVEIIAVQISNGIGQGSITRTVPCSIQATVTAPSNSGLDVTSVENWNIASGTAIKYAMTNPGDGDANNPSVPGSTDNTVEVTVKALDQFDNVATAESRDLTMVLSGSATFLTGSGVVDIINGVGKITFKNDIAETVTLNLVDTGTTGLDVSSSEQVRIYWGATTQFFITSIPLPNPAIGGFKEVKIEARDQHGNVVEVEQRDVTLVVSNDFGSASASLAASNSDPKELVDIVDGYGNVYVTSPDVGDVTITLEDTEGTSLSVSSTRIVPFAAVQDFTTTEDNRDVTFTLSLTELNEIKKLLSLGTKEEDTFITFSGNAMTDLADNALNELTVPQKAAAYAPDISPPTLKEFDLVQENSELKLILYFSETVNAASIKPSMMTLQSSTNSPQFSKALSATTVATTHTNSPIITVIIADDDVAGIRALFEVGEPGTVGTGLARQPANTHLSMARGAVLDMVDLENIAIDATNARAVQTYNVDLISPVIVAYTVDMNSHLLTLTYSEAVSSANLDGTKIGLQNTLDGSELTFSVASTGHTQLTSTIVQVDLTTTLVNSLKALPAIFSADVSSYLSVQIELVKDLQGNLANPVKTTNSLKAATFVPDTTAAALKAFDLDLSLSKLYLEFDEPVDGASVTPSEIILQGNADGSVAGYRLTGGTPEHVFARMIEIDLTYADVTTLKHRTDIAMGESTTFLSLFERKQQIEFMGQFVDGPTLDSQVANDMALVSNEVTHIDATSALAVRTYTADTIATSIETFELSIATGELKLTFVEPVDISSLTVGEITLSDDQLGTTAVSNMAGSITETGERSLTIALIKADLERVKSKALCTAVAAGTDCYISHTSAFVKDNANVEIEERSLTASLLVTNYEADNQAPVVTKFVEMDLNTGSITITFSETVLTSTFAISTVSLQTAPFAANPTSGLNKLTFTSGTVQNLDVPTLEVVFYPDWSELNRLKEDPLICATPLQCYLVITDETVTDMAGNKVEATALSQPGFLVETLVVDNVSPTLLSFELDMDLTRLTLSFSESVDGATLDSKAITLQPLESATSISNFIALTGGTAPATKSDVIIIDLISDDVNALLSSHLATSASDSFLYFDNTLIKDCAFNPNSITAVLKTEAMQVVTGAFTADTTAPELRHFSLDLDKPLGELVLSFNEPVSPSTFQVTAIQIQSKKIRDGATQSYTLTGGSLATASNPPITDFVYALNSITLILSEADQTALKTDFGLAVTEATTFIVVGDAMIEDAGGKGVTAITDDDALQITAGELTLDTRPAEVTDVKIDFDLKTLTIKFNDVVDASSFKVKAVTLQSDSDTDTAASSYTLQTSTIVDVDGYFMVISLSAYDELEINKLDLLATSDVNTYVTLASTAFKDVDGKNILAVEPGIQVSTFDDDVTSPTLDDFDIDFSTEIVTLAFSEAVDLDSFEHTAITFNGAADASDVNTVPTYTLTSGDAPTISVDQLTVQFKLAKVDVDEIKRIDGLFTVDTNGATTDTFMEHTKHLVMDMFGVESQAIDDSTSKPVRTFTPDTVLPELVSFTVDMDAAKLFLSFSEPILASSIVIPQKLVLTDGVTLETATLTDGTATTTDSLIVVVSMTHTDMGVIKVQTSLFADKAKSILTVSANLVTDMAGNRLNPSTKPAVAYTPDATEPILVNFAVNMHTGTIQLNFDEPVRANTLVVQNVLKLQGAADTTDATVESFSVQTVTSNDVNSPHLLLTLDKDELDAIKKFEDLFTLDGVEGSNDSLNTYISFTSALVKDMSNNAVVAVSSTLAERVTTYTDDTVRPTLESFDLDMSAATGTISLTFSETVDISTFSVTGITLQNAFSVNSANAHQLTDGTITTGEDSTVIDITLDKRDFDAIKLKRIGTADATTYLVLADGTVKDMARATSVPLGNGSTAKQVSILTQDNVQPTLDTFDLNVNTGTIDLYFSEPVESDDLDATKLRLQSKRA